MRRIIIIMMGLVLIAFASEASAQGKKENTALLIEKNQYSEARELRSQDAPTKALTIQAASLPTSPPAGVTYHTVERFGDSAKVGLSLSDDRLYLYAEPLTAKFFLCSSSFSVRQNNVLYEDVNLVTPGGNSLCWDLTEPAIAEFTCWSFAESCFDITQSFTVYYVGDHEQTFTYIPYSDAPSFTYYIPYFSSQPGYWTGLAVSNSNASQAADISVTVYNKAGNSLATESKTIAANGQDAWVVGQGTSDEGWMRINSSQKLTGLCFLGTSGADNYMADIPFTQSLGKVLHIPHVAQDTEWDTSVFACNPASLSQTLTITYYNKQGVPQTPYATTIPAHGSAAYPLSSIISGQASAGKVVIESSQGVAAFTLYMNTMKGGNYYAGISAVAPD
jgi:hypothetical protein